MKAPIVAAFQDFQRIMVVCPKCGGIHLLSELKLSYGAKARPTWLDALRREEKKIEAAEERFEEQRTELQEAAREKGRRQLPALLKKSVPEACRLGYYPQDMKAMFDPVDFVVFDGMSLKGQVRRVVLLDGPPKNRRRERVQRSLAKVLKKGNYEWRTVRLGEDGRIVEQKKD